MRISGKRFLFIGAAGFIGSHVVDRLLAARAAKVRARRGDSIDGSTR